jgi:hypothetical protein
VIRVADAFRLESLQVIGPRIGAGASLIAATLHPDQASSPIAAGRANHNSWNRAVWALRSGSSGLRDRKGR